ncbi:hypothetical protein LTR17_020374 [Elasticomyces elasticus]|nr:hypothetical protein LTR17_020374 [Elasticomyces elasticus]
MSDTEQAGERATVATQQSHELSATEDASNSTTIPDTPQQDGHDESVISPLRLRAQFSSQVMNDLRQPYMNAPGELPLLWGCPSQRLLAALAMRTFLGLLAPPSEDALRDIPLEERAPPLVIEHARILLCNPPLYVPQSILRVLRNAAAGLPSWDGLPHEEIATTQLDGYYLCELMNSSLDSLLDVMNWRLQELMTNMPHSRGPLDPFRGTVPWQINDRPLRPGEPAPSFQSLDGAADAEDFVRYVQGVSARRRAEMAAGQSVDEEPNSTVRRATLHVTDHGDLATPQLQEARAETPDLGDGLWDTEYGHCRRYLENTSGHDQVGVKRSGWRELARGLRDSLATTEWFSVLEAVTNIADGVRIFDNTTTAERELLICDLAEFAGAHPGDQIVPLVFQSFLHEEEQELHREEIRARDDAYAERRARRDTARNLSTRHGFHAEWDTHQYEAVRRAREEQINRLLVDSITSADGASDPPAPGTTGPRTLLMRLGEGGDLVEIEVSGSREDSSSGQRDYRTDAEIVQDEEAAEDDIELMGLEIGINDLQGLSFSVDIEAMVEAQNKLIEEERLYGSGVDWWRQ